MAITKRQLGEQHEAMIRELQARHARLRLLNSQDPAFDEQYEVLVAHAEELLEFERLLPGRRAEPRRIRSAQIVKWSWRAETCVALALIAAVFVLGRTAWWLVLLVPHLFATVVGWSIEVTAVRHKQHRAAAIGLHAVGVLVVLVVLGVLSGWWVIAVLIGWVIVGAASQEDAQQGAGSGK